MEASRILDAFRKGRKEEESSDLRSVAVVLREFHGNPNFLSLSVHFFLPDSSLGLGTSASCLHILQVEAS